MSLPGQISNLARLPSPSSSAFGDVDGPSSATDNAVAVFNGTTGKIIKNSVVTIDSTGNETGVLSLAINQGSIPAAGNRVLDIQSSASVAAGSGSLRLYGTNNTERLEILSTVGGGINGFAFGGTISVPTRTTAGQTLVFLGGGGYDNAGSPAQAINKGLVSISASENWTTTAQGCAVLIAATPIGSTTRATVAQFDSNGEQLTGALTATGAITSSSATGGVGYATGAGGTVTQITSRTTGVTLNKTTGAITLVSAAGSATWQSFTVTNSSVAATDVVVVNQKSGTDLYMLSVTNVAAGSFRISFATTGGTTVEQPVFAFAVIKGATA